MVVCFARWRAQLAKAITYGRPVYTNRSAFCRHAITENFRYFLPCGVEAKKSLESSGDSVLSVLVYCLIFEVIVIV